mgnify:CR=1 FL=1
MNNTIELLKALFILVLSTGALILDIYIIINAIKSFKRIKNIEKIVEEDHQIIKELYRRQDKNNKELQELLTIKEDEK